MKVQCPFCDHSQVIRWNKGSEPNRLAGSDPYRVCKNCGKRVWRFLKREKGKIVIETVKPQE